MNLSNSNDNLLLVLDDVLNTYKSKYHGLKALENYHSWFPILPSRKLAGIVADLMGDGHLQGKPFLRLDYTSKYKKELLRFNKEIFNLFGINGKIRPCTTNKYSTFNLGVNNKPLARVLILIGVPPGPKVLTKFSIPSWILRDKSNFSYFINRLFSCDGTVDLKYKFIEIKMYKALHIIDDGVNFFSDIKKGLEDYFGIMSTNPFLERTSIARKDGIKTKAVRLKIKKKESIRRFKEFIGLDDTIKYSRLIDILD